MAPQQVDGKHWQTEDNLSIRRSHPAGCLSIERKYKRSETFSPGDSRTDHATSPELTTQLWLCGRPSTVRQVVKPSKY